MLDREMQSLEADALALCHSRLLIRAGSRSWRRGGGGRQLWSSRGCMRLQVLCVVLPLSERGLH